MSYDQLSRAPIFAQGWAILWWNKLSVTSQEYVTLSLTKLSSFDGPCNYYNAKQGKQKTYDPLVHILSIIAPGVQWTWARSPVDLSQLQLPPKQYYVRLRLYFSDPSLIIVQAAPVWRHQTSDSGWDYHWVIQVWSWSYLRPKWTLNFKTCDGHAVTSDQDENFQLYVVANFWRKSASPLSSICASWELLESFFIAQVGIG